MKNMKLPMRKCTGCGEMKTKKELLRVLKTPEDEIVMIPQAVKTDVAHISAQAWTV